MKRNEPETTYAQMGMAALLPGMTHMLDLMQRHIDEFRAQLNGLQSAPNGRGRPRGKPAATGKSGWPDDPEARSVEMKRRQAIARDKLLKRTHNVSPEGRAAMSAAQTKRWAKAKAAVHPRDPQHPQHAEWVAKMARANRRAWKQLSDADKKARIEKALAGRRRKAAPTVKMAVAS